VIHARGLSRSFKSKQGVVEAVKGIDLDVAEGEIVGLLGPNGAGKTTTLRMLTTLITPTSGTATVAGADVVSGQKVVRSRIGYVAQIGAMPAPGTLVGEELVTQARLQGLSKADAEARLRLLLPAFDLEGFEKRALSEMSGGQRRRFDVALGLMHTPRLVFLDEPTTGLDPQSRANLWEHVRDLRAKQGVTILLTTHYLDEADALCDRIVVMDHGTIVANDTPAALKAQVSGDVIALKVDDLAKAEQIARKTVDVRNAIAEEETLHVTVSHGDTALPPLLAALSKANLTLRSVSVSSPTLDDVFHTLTVRSLRDDE
jgi:ABC-2 type transport system ATP-binding protein